MTPRGCRPDEADSAVELLNEVFWTSEGQPPELLSLFPALYPPDDCDDHRVIVHDHRVVAHVGIVPITMVVPTGRIRIAGISGVATRADLRGRGLATSCMEDAVRRIDEREYDVSVLWTGMEGFYERWGYTWAGLRTRYELTRDALARIEVGDWRCEAYCGRDDQLAAMLALEAQQPFRRERSADNLRRNLTALRRGAWLGSDGDGVRAYVVIGDPWQGSPRVDLYGGDTRGVVALLRHAMAEQRRDTLRLGPPPGDPLRELLEGAGLTPSEQHVAMCRVADEARLLANAGVAQPSVLPPGAERPVAAERLRRLLGHPPDPRCEPVVQLFLWQIDHC